MFKKLMVLCAPLAVTVGLAVLPAVSQADPFYRCPKSATYVKYCEQITLCVVPRLRGLTLREADTLLAEHDCRLGNVTRPRRHRRGRATIIGQSPRTGAIREDRFRVDVRVDR